MKLYRISFAMLGALMLTTACSDIDEMAPEGGSLTKEQLTETNSTVPERVAATFSGMFSMMAEPNKAFQRTSPRADDFGFPMMCISLDLEGADMMMQDNGYNWFSTCGEYSSRNANYANPYIRYVIPYRQIGIANDVINAYPEDIEDSTAVNLIAQARAIRAFDYMMLAPYFAFNYDKKDDLCVPILKNGVDFSHNPRATVQETWDYIMEDLNYAVSHLNANRVSKDQININVAYGLRARANLYMGKYAEAAADAAEAMKGFVPASMAEISLPAFFSLTDHNWMWGINVTSELQDIFPYATSASWISAFSGNAYAAGTENVPSINSMLYKKIPATDLRKNWWLDENKHTPNWASLTWTDPKTGASATGDAIAAFTYDDKMEFHEYNNVKFGMKSGVGAVVNDNDWPLMRVEEMILIQAEGLAKSGKEAEAKSVLENFVKTYRDPSYDVNGRGLSLANEIWFQRRIELWGEGFFMFDAKRLGKPVVRFHGEGTSNEPTAFAFNIDATDGWLNMRFPQDEMDNNTSIIDNTGGEIPKAGQNPNLRDGVTD
jgi:hypothetical protein